MSEPNLEGKEVRVDPLDGNGRIILSDQGHGYLLISDIFETHIASITKEEWEKWEIAGND